MKHALFTAALLFGSLTSASAMAQAPAQDTAPAQQQRHMHHDPHRQAMHLGKKLGLSADQTAKLEPIFAQHRDQVEALRQNTSLTPEQRHAQMRDLNRNTHQQLAGVLTPDQMQQLKQMRKQHRHQQDANPSAPAGV
jgi:periplasmic protein CpxP/Spy